MKEITAIIKPFMLSKVEEALVAAGTFPGMTVTECRGIGRNRLQRASQDKRVGLEFAGKVKIQIVVPDDVAERLAEVIVKAAHTGHHGDGLVYITPVDAAIKVKTFDRGEAAL